MLDAIAHRARASRATLAALILAALVPGWRAHAQPLTLAEAQRLAAREAPSLAAQDAAIRAAREAVGPASELPDPKLFLGVENLLVDGPYRFQWTKDSMTMRRIGVMQDFVRGEKLRLRSERAQAEARREEAILAVNEANLRRDVALAWIEVWLAERQLALLRDLERESELATSTAQAALAGGRGQSAEPVAARLSAALIGDRMVEARRAIAKARAQLARWLPKDAERPVADAPDFRRLGHGHDDLFDDVARHPHLAMYVPMQAMAEAEVKLADAARRPDWTVELSYAKRGVDPDNALALLPGSASPATDLISLMVRIDLPILESRRQGPLAAAKAAAAEQVRAQAEEARRAHLAELRMLYAEWQGAMERVERFESTVLPLARERTQAALAAYRGGKAELAPVLEARRGEIEQRLAHFQAMAEAARAWAQLSFILPTAQTEGGRR